MTRRVADLNLGTIDRITDDSILVQPVGAIEQHGPHLPYHTDLTIAAAAAETLVESRGDDLDLWLLEPLAYTKSNEHAWAPGTVWVSAQTLLAVLDDLARALTTLPSRKLVFLNGHGGNSAILNVACRDIRLAHGFQTFLVHPMVPPDQGGVSAASEHGMGVHAGRLETSLMMHLAPALVAGDVPSANVPERLADTDLVGFGKTVTFGWSSDDFGPDGHIGDPTGASAEEGAGAFEAIVERLGAAFEEIRDFRF